MSLVPAFEIGLWNAWIFMLIMMLPAPIFALTALRNRAPSAPDTSLFNRDERKILFSSKIMMFIPVIYSIFLPFKLGTLWFYTGLPIAIAGTALYIVTWVNLAISPLDKEPSTRGLYRYSRHPMYISGFIVYLGVGIACASWLFLLLTIFDTSLTISFAKVEERFLLQKYGDAYQEYIKRTPRWLGVLKT